MNRFLQGAAALAFLAAPAAVVAQTERFDVYFPFDSAELTPEARGVVQDAARTFAQTGEADLFLQGHADTVGNVEYNFELSRRRAETVQQALVELGVPRDSIVADWTGETNLPVPTEDGVRLQENRVVSIALVQPEPMAEPAPPPQEPERDLGFGITAAPYFGASLEDDGNDDYEIYFPGVNFTATFEPFDFAALEVEQAVFYSFNGEDNGFGGRTAIGANAQLPFAADTVGQIIPYVGYNFGAIYHDGSYGDTFFHGPEIGINVGFLEAKVAYDIAVEHDAEDGVISATLGFGYRF